MNLKEIVILIVDLLLGFACGWFLKGQRQSASSGAKK